MGSMFPPDKSLTLKVSFPLKLLQMQKYPSKKWPNTLRNGITEHPQKPEVGCELCKVTHYAKDCPLKEEGNTLEEAYYTQFGAPYQPAGQYRAAGPGFYQRNNGNSSYPDRRQTLEESLTKFMAESAKRHEENSNIIMEIRASTDAAIRNQGASIKTLEIQIDSVITFLRQWGIENKVFTITLDNATNNNGLVDCLKDQLGYDALVCNGEFIHVRCCAHVLNLIVQSGLKVIEESIKTVRESVKFVRGSAARKIKFLECVARLKLQCGKNVRQDVVTRWNYTYLMLDCALAYRRAFVLLGKLDKTFKTCPTPDEWTRIEAIAMFLKPFYDITKLFSGTLYSTSNLYFHNVYKIQKAIQRHMLNPDRIISGMARDMKTKFDKYWETYTMVLSFGAILDPRYKLNIVEFYLSELGMEGPLLIEKVQSVEDGLRKLYSAYEVQPNVMRDSTKGPSSNVEEGRLCDDAEDDLAGFETFQSQYKKLEVSRVGIVARDILSIPITTVASESTFSIGGRIISKYRSSLSSENAEALLCTRDWLFDLKDEDEVDKKELIDEDIEKLVKSSSKVIIGGGGSSSCSGTCS
ncbi:zinc finger BED domain-containing protein RICESLEEPER 2-like protein [Tanacetum coccineum]